MKYSEPILYVKKEVKGNDIGEEDTSVMKPLPQYRCLLPVYNDSYQELGSLQMVTNKQIDNSVCVRLRVGK